MQYVVTRQVVKVLGGIWLPMGAQCAQEKRLTEYDMANIGNPRKRADVERWVMLNSGDFSSVTDFSADFHVNGKHIVHEWAKGDESEIAWSDAMYPPED